MQVRASTLPVGEGLARHARATIRTGNGSAGIEGCAVLAIESGFAEARVRAIRIQTSSTVAADARNSSAFVDIGTAESSKVIDANVSKHRATYTPMRDWNPAGQLQVYE